MNDSNAKNNKNNLYKILVDFLFHPDYLNFQCRELLNKQQIYNCHNFYCAF